jgi:hypothetical protein
MLCRLLMPWLAIGAFSANRVDDGAFCSPPECGEGGTIERVQQKWYPVLRPNAL